MKTRSGRTITFWAKASETFKNTRAKEGIALDQQRLFLFGKQLQNGSTIWDNNIKQNTNSLVLRLGDFGCMQI